MSEQWSKFDSEQADAQSISPAESSANGVSPDYAVGVAEPLGEEATTTNDDLTDGAATAEKLGDEVPVAEVADDGPADTTEDVLAAPGADDGSAFLAELVRTMQATAGLERIRIGEAIERRRQERVDQVQERKASEADRMRVLAAEDMAEIEAWVDRETARIKLERERRETAVREDLDASLAEHASKIDQEIQGIEAAIAKYRAEVDAYFEGLDRETDPVVIAQQAARRPAFPTLDAVVEPVGAVPHDAVEEETASAEAASADEPAVVGVMDPDAPVEPVESWAASPEANTTPEPAGGSDDGRQDGTPSAPVEAEADTVRATIGGPGALLQSVPAKRPMSWLRRSED